MRLFGKLAEIGVCLFGWVGVYEREKKIKFQTDYHLFLQKKLL